MKRILLIGANSSIARSYKDCLTEVEVICTSRDGQLGVKLDLLDVKTIPEQLLTHVFDVAIVFAGMTNIQECEQHPEMAQRINCNSLLVLRSALKIKRWILLSTNLVFSGKQPKTLHNNEHAPFNQYGLSKANMERSFLAKAPHQVAIVRITKVVTPSFTLFKNWLAKIRQGEVISAFDDMTLSPIGVTDVAKFLHQLTLTFKSGIHQLSGKGDDSYFHVINCLAEKEGLDRKHIMAASKTVTSPEFTSLHVSEKENELGFSPPDFHQVFSSCELNLGKGGECV